MSETKRIKRFKTSREDTTDKKCQNTVGFSKDVICVLQSCKVEKFAIIHTIIKIIVLNCCEVSQIWMVKCKILSHINPEIP